MTPRKLLATAWVGRLVTLGGVVAILVLILTSSRFSAEFDPQPLWGDVFTLILMVFAIGWIYGACLGREGVPFFAALLAILCVLALTKSEHLDSGLMASAVLIGPLVLSWPLGCLWALRREAAAGPD